MADTSEYNREKRKRVFKKIDKEFDNIAVENMKTPVATFTKQTSSRLKNSHPSAGYFDDQSSNFLHSSNFWDKRNNSRRYNADGEYRGGFGGKAWRYYEGAKEAFRNDTGRPPGGSEETPSENCPVVTPVILMREKSTVEAKGSNTTPAATTNSASQQNESETPKCDSVPPPTPVPAPAPTRQYQIATKPSVLEAVVIPEQEMSSSLKLLDDSLLLGEDLGPYLLDQSHFLVVAVAGLQGAGKSTIASLLADPLKGLKLASTRSWVFRPESRDEVLRGCHSTSGVDAFITKDRVIILDLQPLLSPSVMDYVVTQERKASLDYSSTENLLEVESLQLLTFALSVAHVVVVVQDYILHPNLLRLLHTCQMMKPSHSSSSSSNTSSSSHNASSGGLAGNRDGINRGGPFDGSDTQQYYPHLVFVHNRAFPHQFMPKCVEELQFLYQTTLCDSNLCFESQIGVCSGTFTPPLSNLSTNLNVNIFLIPDIDFQDKCAASFMESIQEMRRQLFSLSRCPLTHVTLTEKSWYQYACRMWESIRKSNLYVEYSRLLP